MKFGIKYCGGCNPRYDRSQLYRRIVADFGHIRTIEFAKESETYETLFVIGGCTNCCAKADHYVVSGEVVRLKEPEDYEKHLEKNQKQEGDL